ncbi:hypothetical protein X777_11923 [Ooceraea biroi]|uniref:Transmembrane protein n=1 Tax=Ooceraea biroi TaxID=2015173 RepID=A0A026W0F2_OOCBI|nr:hypothetical protein X777_11923 [Ooceraea biroi]
MRAEEKHRHTGGGGRGREDQGGSPPYDEIVEGGRRRVEEKEMEDEDEDDQEETEVGWRGTKQGTETQRESKRERERERDREGERTRSGPHVGDVQYCSNDAEAAPLATIFSLYLLGIHLILYSGLLHFIPVSPPYFAMRDIGNSVARILWKIKQDIKKR